MKLRSRKSLVNKREEGDPPPVRRLNLTKWLYFGLLIGIAVYLGMAGVRLLVMVDKQGLVLIERNRLSPLRDGRVEEFAIREGEAVRRNQLLVRLAPVTDCPTMEPAAERIPKPDPRIEKLAFDLQLNEHRLRLLDRRLASYPRKRDRPGLELALELELAGAKPSGSDGSRLEKLSVERDLLRGEIRLQRNTLLSWRQREALRQSALEQASQPPLPIPEACLDEEIRAPFDGTVNALHLNLHEYAKHGQPLVTLEKHNAPVRIEVYTSPKKTPFWSRGEQVRVEFPDETRDRGIIQTLHSSAYKAVALERDDYVPSDTQLLVHVLPKDHASAQRWRKYDRMRVRVQAWR